GVIGLTEIAPLARYRRHQKESSAVILFAKHPDSCPRAGEGATQVRIDNGIEIVVGHVPENLVTKYAGIGTHDVEPAEFLHCPVDTALRGLRRAYGHDLRQRLPPFSLYGRNDFFCSGLVHVVYHHGGTRARQPFCYLAPHPATAARNNSDFSIKLYSCHANTLEPLIFILRQKKPAACAC